MPIHAKLEIKFRNPLNSISSDFGMLHNQIQKWKKRRKLQDVFIRFNKTKKKLVTATANILEDRRMKSQPSSPPTTFPTSTVCRNWSHILCTPIKIYHTALMRTKLKMITKINQLLRSTRWRL